MAIDFTTASPADWNPSSEITGIREARAAEKHAAWQRGQEQKALDRQKKEAEEAQKQAVKGVEAEADFFSHLTGVLDTERKEQEKRAKEKETEARKKVTDERADIRFTQEQEDRARTERDRDVKTLSRRNMGLNFETLDDMTDYVGRSADSFVDLKEGAKANPQVMEKLGSSLGLNVVSSNSLTPTDPAFTSRFGFSIGADGLPVITEKFLAIAADRNRSSKEISTAIAKTLAAARKSYIKANTTVAPDSAAKAEAEAPETMEAEEIKAIIDSIRREDVNTFKAARKVYDKYNTATTEAIQGRKPSEASVGEPGVGESFDTAPSFVGNVFAELANLSKSPSTMFRLVRDYGKYVANTSGDFISGQRALQDVPGMLEAGNLDLSRRPEVKNKDGSISTVRSMSVGIDGKEYLIPTVSTDGKLLTEDEAVELFRKTGEHLGVFDTPEHATAYARQLHKDQEKLLIDKKAKEAGKRAVTAAKTVDNIIQRMEDEYEGLNSVALRENLMDEAKVAEAAVKRLAPMVDLDEMRAVADKKSHELGRTIESDYRRDYADTLYAELEKRNPGLSRDLIRTLGTTELLNAQTNGLKKRGSLDDAVAGAMSQYRSAAGQVADVLTFQPGNLAGKTSDPLSTMEWRQGARGWEYGMVGGPTFEVSTEQLRDYMKNYGIKSTRDALNSLSHAARQGDLNLGRGTLFAYNPHTKEVDTNATLQYNPNALYDDDLFNRSVNQLQESGADPELIEKTIEQWKKARTKSASEMVKQNMELEETLGALRDTWMGTGAGFAGGWVMDRLDKMLSFKEFYNNGKENGQSDEQILAAWQKEGQGAINSILRGLQIGTHKFADIGTGAVAGSLLFASNLIGSDTGREKARTMWNTLNEKQQAEGELVKGNLMADMTAEIVNLGYQMVATHVGGSVGSLAGRALERTAMNGLIKASAKVIARRTEALVPAARPGLASSVSGGIQRVMNRAANINLQRAGAGAGVNTVIANQVVPQAYSEIFYAVYDREMEGKEPTAENLEAAQAKANIRALMGSGIAGGMSILINNRAGMESFMRKVVGAKNLRRENWFNRVDERLSNWRRKDWTDMTNLERTKAVASYLYSCSKVSAEGATEELADEFQEWAVTELAKNGEISEQSIGTFEGVVEAGAKIAFLGALGGIYGARIAGETPAQFQLPAMPTATMVFKEASQLVESTGKALESVDPTGPTAPLLESGRKTIEVAGDRGDVELVATEWVNKTVANEELHLSNEQKAQWISMAPALGMTNFQSFRNYVQEASDRYQYEGEVAAAEYLAEVIRDLPNTMAYANDTNVGVMRSMLTEAFDAMKSREANVPLDDNLDLQGTGDESLDEASIVINALTNEPTVSVETVEPTATTEPTVPVAKEEANKIVAPVQEFLDNGTGREAAEETVDALAAGTATFDPNTGAWLTQGSLEQRAEKLVVLNSMTSPTGPVVTTNTGESIVMTPNASMYAPSANPKAEEAPTTKWGNAIMSLDLPTDGTGVNGINLLNRLSVNATQAQRKAIEGLTRALNAAGLDLAVRMSTAVDGNFSPAMITYNLGSDGELSGGVIDLFTNRENAVEGTTGTLIHEAIHLLDRHLRKNNAEYSREMSKLRSAVAARFNDIHAVLREAYDNSLDPNEMNAIAAVMNDLAYGLKGADEFASVVFSNPVINSLVMGFTGKNADMDMLTRYAETAGKRKPIHNRIIDWLRDLFHEVHNEMQDAPILDEAEWNAYVQRVADVAPEGAWYSLDRPETYAVNVTDYTGNKLGENYFNPMAYESDLSQRMSFGVAAEIVGSSSGNWATMFRNGWRMTRWGQEGINVPTPEQRLILQEQMVNLSASYERVNERLGKVKKLADKYIQKNKLTTEAGQKLASAILDTAGNLDNDIDPETVERINRETNAEIAQLKETRDYRINAAKQHVQRVVNQNAELIRAANLMASTSEGRTSINEMVRLLNEVGREGYSATVNAETMAPAMDQRLTESINSLGSRVRDLGNKALASRYYALARNTKSYILDQVNGVESPFTQEELQEGWDNLRSDYLRDELSKNVEMANMLRDIKEAKAQAREWIKEANAEYAQATRHTGIKADGTVVESGIVWKKRDAALLEARRKKQAEFMARREAGEKYLKEQGVIGSLIYNAVVDARKEIAVTQMAIARITGDSKMKDNAKRMDYLHRTYLAVGKHGGDYTKTMREIIANPNGETAQAFKGLTALLNEAATAHAEAHQREMAETVSTVLDNMQALATLHDELNLEIVPAGDMANENNALLFNGVAKNFRSRNILDFIHDNYGEIQLASDLKNGVNMSSIYDKAMSMIAQSDRHTAKRLDKVKRRLRTEAQDKYLESLLQDVPGDTLLDKLGSFNSGDALAHQINEILPMVPVNAINQIWNTPHLDIEEKLNDVVDLLRKQAEIQMNLDGLGNVINAQDIKLLEYPQLAELAMSQAKEAIDEVLSKKRTREDVTAMRKREPKWKRKAMHELHDTTIGEAIGVLQNTISLQSKLAVNQVLSDEYATVLKDQGIVVAEDSTDRTPDMVEITLKNKRNSLNGLYTMPDVARAIYKIYMPSDEIMDSKTSTYEDVRKYWKSTTGSHSFATLGGYTNMATLIASPSSTFRNAYGTAAQMLHAGAFPIKGLKDIGSLVKEWGQMHQLYLKSQEGGIGAESSAQKLLQAEDKYNEKIRYWQEIGLLDAGQGEFLRNIWKSEEFAAIQGELESTDSEDSFYAFAEALENKRTKTTIKDVAKKTGHGVAFPVKLAAFAYGMPDAAAKIALFGNQQALSRKQLEIQLERATMRATAGEELNARQKALVRAAANGEVAWNAYVDRHAASKVKTLLPTGTRTPKWVKYMGQYVAPYFMFQYHTFQSTMYNVGYGMEEISDGVWAIKNGMSKDGAYLVTRGLGRFIGSAAALTAMPMLSRWILFTALRASMGDDEDKMQFILNEGVLRKMAEAGLFPEYDKYGDLLAIIDKEKNEFTYFNLDYGNPYKNVVKAFGTLFKLAVNYDEDRWSSRPAAELHNLLENTVLAPSMFLATALELFDKEGFHYQYATTGNENVAFIPGVLNALTVLAGFDPLVGGGHTWDGAERLATTLNNKVPFYSWMIKSARGVGGDTPDLSGGAFLAQTLGAGMRRPKDLTETLAQGLKNSQASLNRAKRMTILKPNYYKRMESGADVDAVVAEESEAILNNYTNVVNGVRFVYGLSQTLPESIKDAVLASAIERSGMSANRFKAAMSGILPELISKEAAKEAIARLQLEDKKASTTERGHELIQKQIDLIIQVAGSGSADVNDRALSQKEIDGALQQ